jgi:hypothetical protein
LRAESDHGAAGTLALRTRPGGEEEAAPRPKVAPCQQPTNSAHCIQAVASRMARNLTGCRSRRSAADAASDLCTQQRSHNAQKLTTPKTMAVRQRKAVERWVSCLDERAAGAGARRACVHATAHCARHSERPTAGAVNAQSDQSAGNRRSAHLSPRRST